MPGNWGMAGRGGASYAKDGVDKVLRIPMIEERAAVDNADEILSVEGVDGVFIFVDRFPASNLFAAQPNRVRRRLALR
jgi:2-keto-3-deoxy-L-rhamnonate aldolase RhmA